MMLNTSVTSFTIQDVTPVYNASPDSPQTAFLHPVCISAKFSEMPFFPWDNPDNIVTAKVESMSRRIKDHLLVLFFLLGGPGNVINMAVFYKQGLKDRVNLCLFALSLADELYLLASLMYHGEEVFMQFTTQEVFKTLKMFLTNNHFTAFLGFCYVSQVLYAIIASERCYCVLKPLKFQSLMRTRTMAVIISAVYIIVMGLFFIVAFRYRGHCAYDVESGVVMGIGIIGEVYQQHRQLIDYLDSFVFGVGLPGVVILTVLIATITTIMKLRQIVTWRAETSSSLSAREVALTKMLVGTSILFIACVFPFAVARFCWLFFPEMNAGGRHQNFFLTGLWMNEILTYINASFNIVIYCVMGSRYRQTFWALFSTKRRPEHMAEAKSQQRGDS